MAVGTYALCSLKEVKNYYVRSGGKSPHVGTDEDDKLFESIIDSMSAIFETECDTQFKSREYTEYHDGNGGKFLFPAHNPITVVSGIWDSTDWDWDATTLIDADDYMIKNENTIVLKASTFTEDDQNIKIILAAGYAAVPDDVNLACIEEVSRAYKNRKGVDVLAKTASDGSVTRYNKDLMPSTLRILKKYRNRTIQ